MSKKRKKHGYAERLKYMHMLEHGVSINHIESKYGISNTLLGYLWERYQSELALRINTTKSYISKLEKGHVTPSAGLFFSIINALGMHVEIVK
jgi:transcriptional regulator with XRE-family HTH domain